MKKARGFTLIELMVVVVVIAILAAIAIPSYLNQTRKSRRNAAKAAIQQIALLEERYRADNSGYLASSGNWSQLGGDPTGTYYQYSVSVAPATSVAIATYTITATGKSTQLKDYDRSTASDCKNLSYSLSSTGTIFKTPSGCW
jgi:type IV pilus assembly protein PilE